MHGMKDGIAEQLPISVTVHDETNVVETLAGSALSLRGRVPFVMLSRACRRQPDSTEFDAADQRDNRFNDSQQHGREAFCFLAVRENLVLEFDDP